MVRMILRWEGLQSLEDVLIHWLLMKGGDVCVDIFLVFRLESPSHEGYAIRCWVAKQQSGWDFQDQRSVVPLKTVHERFTVNVEVMCHVLGCQSHVQTLMPALMSSE